VRLIPSVLLATLLLPVVARAQDVPPPLPFPRSGGNRPQPASPPPAPSPPPPPAPSAPAPAAPPARPAPITGERPSGVPTDEQLGMPGLIYPSAEFLDSFDLGRGQHCYLFGTNLSYGETLAYYKGVLKDGGRELLRAPAMQQWDLGKFQDQTMAAQPSVTVKDYTFDGGEGYLQVKGTQSARFKTVIQIVPLPGR
jgi:hypothetical protein